MAKECSSTTCDKTSCEGCSHKEPKSLQETMNVYSSIKHVIGVVSGKGGVGKSVRYNNIRIGRSKKIVA